MQHTNGFVITENGPFHAAGTRIFREADRSLISAGPNCRVNPVPSRYSAELEKYAEPLGHDRMTSMNGKLIELRAAEQALLERIDFEPTRQTHDFEQVQEICNAAGALTALLMERNAIPEVRLKYFADADYNVGGHGSSRLEIFEKNGTSGDAIFTHPIFLKCLRYFLYGPDLPGAVVDAFQKKVDDCGMVTSGDVIPLGNYAKQLTRSHGLDTIDAPDEFYKLALDCGLDEGVARSVRNAVMKVR